jgi:hypothetical protein
MNTSAKGNKKCQSNVVLLGKQHRQISRTAESGHKKTPSKQLYSRAIVKTTPLPC